MSTNFTIQRATGGDSQEVAVMVGELLSGIMNVFDDQVFNVDLAETTSRLQDFLNRERYGRGTAKGAIEDF
ncbi:MAG: hypothetical protein JZU65_24290 [Chlorobium sp.]|jgi:hypothetical protein|nr:hypothetical protein [Chlorobium sp.]